MKQGSLIFTIFYWCFYLGSRTAGAIENKPNVIILLMDDLGWDDIGFHGNAIVKTPTLDNLKKESIECTQVYVTPVCAPSRAEILTGMRFLHTGVSHVHGGKDYIHTSIKLLPEYFKSVGYTTAMYGKWHSGNGHGYWPWQRGFDEAMVSDLYKHRNSSGLLNGQRVITTKWSSEVIADYAVEFIQKQRDKPFFLYLPFLAPHSPLQAPEELIANYTVRGLSKNLATLYAMIDQTDKAIGKVLEALKKQGAEENTIVIFLSDNGPAVEYGTLTEEDWKIRNLSSMIGYKGSLFPYGIKTPFLIKYPSKLKAGKNEMLADATDILPTLAEWCGFTFSEKITGRSMSQALEKSIYQRSGKEVLLWAHKAWIPDNTPYSPLGKYNEYYPISQEDKTKLSYENQPLCRITDDSYTIMHHLKYPLIGLAWNNFSIKKTYPKTVIKVKEQLNDEKLQSWWQSVLSNPISFRAPNLYTNSDSVWYSATLASKSPKNAKHTVHEIKIPKMAMPDTLAFNVHVTGEGNYTLALKGDSLEESDCRLRKINGQEYTCKVNPSKIFCNTSLNSKDTLVSFLLFNTQKTIQLQQIQITKHP